jgi:hypothetical protein
MEAKVIDKLGNNAIVECTVCNKPYVVSSFYKKPRVCPHCGNTQALMEKGGKITVEPVDVRA